MAHSSIRFWFCLAAALIAAAIADPVLEFASNAGWFGPGNFTDHSNLNVFPVVITGLAFVAWHVFARVRGSLADQHEQSHASLRACEEALGSRSALLLPLTFAIQIVALYGMETVEQLIVWRHGLGGTIWLGAPVLISLAVHAGICAGILLTAARAVRALTAAALRVVLLIRPPALVGVRLVAKRRRNEAPLRRFAPVLCGIGERAPPLLTV